MPPAAPPAIFGEPVKLDVGAAVAYPDGLTVLLEAVNDSRCPKGVQCIWQGELAPVLVFKEGKLSEETKLRLGTVRGLAGAAGPYAVALGEVAANSAVIVVTQPAGASAADHSDRIRVSSPSADQPVGSPLTVAGEARGPWYFEASFPVKLYDADGRELAVAPAQAQGDWMTEEFVPFKVELSFNPPTTAAGTLVLERDNPSGLPQNADEIRLPVKFSGPLGPRRAVKLFFYDASKDRDAGGNVLCSRQGLVAVDRDIPFNKTPVQDAIRLLLAGGPTPAERAGGITTEFPLPGLALKGADLENGTLILTFDDPSNRTGGGSCRVGILWSQIEATAKQFPEVKSVRFSPEELFQP